MLDLRAEDHASSRKHKVKMRLTFLSCGFTVRAVMTFITLSVFYRSFWLDVDDPYSCNALLNNGSWLDDVPRTWQPPGCLFREYDKTDIHDCLYNRRVVLIGDSTVRQIYWSFARKMGIKCADNELDTDMQVPHKHKDMSFSREGVSFQFIWDPYLNTSRLTVELASFSSYSTLLPNPSENVIGPISGLANFPEREFINQTVALILIGNPGLWYARHGSENYFSEYKTAIDRVIHSANSTSLEPQGYQPLISDPQGLLNRNSLLFAPVQIPRYVALSPTRASSIKRSKIDRMQAYLRLNTQSSGKIVLWSYIGMIMNSPQAYKRDGMHLVESVSDREADVLLNFRCNAATAAAKNIYDRTCCMTYPSPGIFRLVMMATLAGLLMIGMAWWPISSYSTVKALIVVAGAVHACYQADRTRLFLKSNKDFQPHSYFGACFAVLILCAYPFKKSHTPSYLVRTPSSPAAGSGISRHGRTRKSDEFLITHDPPFLSRGQTDEWKGWMQAIILLYHYMGGSRNIEVYKMIRLLVSSYLFMTGYGHTKSFLTSQDYSFRKLTKLLFRLNALSCVLPYALGTTYMSYYFAPLVTFWSIIVYATMSFCHCRNNDLKFLLSKVLISALLTTSIIIIPGCLESHFYVLKRLFNISGNVHNFRFRLSVDMYIVYVGMIFAAYQNHREKRIHASTDRFNWGTTLSLLSLVLRVLYGTQDFSTKEFYNAKLHPYTSFVPILSFVYLRNCGAIACQYHSSAFSWLGKISLETYVLQYHIWLAGDSHGILRIGLWNRWIEFALLTPVFVWISWKVNIATQILSEWVVPPQREDPPSWLEIDSSRWRRNVNYKILSDFRGRVGIILLGMWLLNMTYP